MIVGFSISWYHVAKLQAKLEQLTLEATCLLVKCVVPYGASVYATLMGEVTSLWRSSAGIGHRVTQAWSQYGDVVA